MFCNTEELFTYLADYYKQHGGKVRIASYGMYVGISNGKDWSKVYPMAVRNFIDSLNKNDLRLIVGLPYFTECKEGCEDCAINYNKTLDRHKETIEQLNINSRFHPQLHLKLYNIGDLYVCGGMNLGKSNFVDVSFIIEDKAQKQELSKLFENTWHDSVGDIKIFKK